MTTASFTLSNRTGLSLISTFLLFGNSFGAISSSAAKFFRDAGVVSSTCIQMISSVLSFHLRSTKREFMVAGVMVSICLWKSMYVLKHCVGDSGMPYRERITLMAFYFLVLYLSAHTYKRFCGALFFSLRELLYHPEYVASTFPLR